MGFEKLNIGLVFDGDLQSGGGYQQQLTTIIELKKASKFNFFIFVFSQENKKYLQSLDVDNVYLIKKSFFDKFYRLLFRQEFFNYLIKKFKLKSIFEKEISRYNLDLIYFLSPSSLSLDLVSHNYIITVWDLCHRDFPEFPEVNFFREFELRERLYKKSLKKAFAILVDSEIGRKNIVKRYGVDEERVYIVPFMPSINIFSSKYIDIRSKYDIKGEYIYYPAQFWPHKNHVYIIEAISMLKKQGIEITALFSGSDKGNLNYVLDYAKNLGVEELIKYIGFAPNGEIYSLYKNALAVVMPTYFGPTNIPPFEAFAIGTPVIYSDLPGLKDQVGDAALLCDLDNPESLANHIIALLKSEKLRIDLINKGFYRLRELQKQNIVNVLDEILSKYYLKLKCWKREF
ncbi:glycosyltransferase family 1 protein [Thermodesulfovibrio sp.]|uniref:glycosyltransferase family 4 protein n=1 Tax=Thermodesulfovibrio sp. TaxID=2067987 RepID=UPI00309DA1FA